MQEQRFVAVDPGVRACGVAAFENGELHRAWWSRGELSDIVDEMTLGADLDLVIIETPITVRGRAFRGSTASLLKLSIAIGELSAFCKARGVKVALTPVSTWKRSVPTEALAARLPKQLTDVESSRIEWPAQSYRHNVVDAIALGRWALKNL